MSVAAWMRRRFGLGGGDVSPTYGGRARLGAPNSNSKQTTADGGSKTRPAAQSRARAERQAQSGLARGLPWTRIRFAQGSPETLLRRRKEGET